MSDESKVGGEPFTEADIVGYGRHLLADEPYELYLAVTDANRVLESGAESVHARDMAAHAQAARELMIDLDDSRIDYSTRYQLRDRQLLGLMAAASLGLQTGLLTSGAELRDQLETAMSFHPGRAHIRRNLWVFYHELQAHLDVEVGLDLATTALDGISSHEEGNPLSMLRIGIGRIRIARNRKKLSRAESSRADPFTGRGYGPCR